MFPAAESEVAVVNKEPLFVDDHSFCMNVFIREALIEKYSAPECIRTIAATYGCKILQLLILRFTLDSLVIWVGAFLWREWGLACGRCMWTFLACALVGMFGSLDILLVGSFDCIHDNFFWE